MACIYALCEPDTFEVRYVGKANDLPTRVRCHRLETKRTSTRKANWIRSLKEQGKEPVAQVLEEVTPENWAEREIYWIAYLREQGARLTNHTDGGQTSPHEGGMGEATKAKLRAGALARGCKPPPRSGQVPWNKGKKGTTTANFRSFRKGMNAWNKGVRQTHCPHGHEYTPENTHLVSKRNENRTYQSCRTCSKAASKAYQQRKKR